MTSLERAAELVRVDEVDFVSEAGPAYWRVVVCGARESEKYAAEWNADRCAAEIRQAIASTIDAAVAEALAVGGVPGVELTAERVREIEERWAKTTPGEWIATCDHPEEPHGEVAVYADGRDDDVATSILGTHQKLMDYAFLASAHQDIPALLADRKRLMAILRDLVQDGHMAQWQAGYKQAQDDAIDADMLSRASSAWMVKKG